MKTKLKIITYSKGKQYRIKLRGKRLLNETISLFLDEYLGYKKEDGKLKLIKKIEVLKIYLVDPPKTTIDRNHNKEALITAEAIRKKRENELSTKGTGLKAAHLKNINFVDYFEKYKENYQNKDIRLVTACLNHFKTFTGDRYIKPIEIDETLVKQFKKHLEKNLNGDTPLNYFTKFKALCKAAVKQRILNDNPCDEITFKRTDRLKKEILTFDEIALLPGAYCGNEDVKMAFLFSLNTGLRYVDIKGLIWKDIDLKNAKLNKVQSKVNSDVHIDLNENAMEILTIRAKGDSNDNIFQLKGIENSNKVLKRWIKKAEIDKHITFHCARHSFATNLLYNNANIKTVSSLLGHSSLRHTEKYTRAVDELKEKAVNSLPRIKIGL